MARQFPHVSARYGAPMGRISAPDLDKSPRSVRLFRVNLDRGGYDDGGAYWGISRPGESLFCAKDRDGDMQFIRASSRNRAALLLDIPPYALKMPLDSGYIAALIDGRAPLPDGYTKQDVFDWINAA